ncbi:nitronate monooxygenase [Clostridiisalibacter paucivorans]|uniref:nitronate monooxygenase n=1 Tax=Clostridiisalibacter paucivorans TaxID=408753 RepID=UPI00047E6FE7|nr:nitronate monooxygenase [Clostridiisalibacter paucivorans]
METKLTRLLNIKYPIIQGAMAWVSDAKLAAAVSEAGGAGTIATGGRESSWVEEQIRLAKTLTDKPFGVNIMLMAENKDEIVDIICNEKVSYVTLGAGNPVPYFERLHNEGIKVVPVVPNVKLAKRVADKGADAIVIEGSEAGGHIGSISSLSLMTQVIPEVDIPVIAAGGFADGRGLAAALVMGASGVQMGTRFYASQECTAHLDAKVKIVNAKDTDTVVTGALHGHSVRGIRNAMTDKYLDMEKAGAKEDELLKLVVGTSRTAPQEGDIEWGMVQAGQSLTAIKNIKPCSEIVDDIITEARKAITNAQIYLR